jgi:hypothetical protein
MTSFKRRRCAVFVSLLAFLRGGTMPAHRRRSEAGEDVFLAALARGKSVRVSGALDQFCAGLPPHVMALWRQRDAGNGGIQPM